jgi:hypothetical protein
MLNVCSVAHRVTHNGFGFLKGAKMKDKLGLLTGDGKAIRVLPLKEMNKEAVKYYIDQAIEINAKK